MGTKMVGAERAEGTVERERESGRSLRAGSTSGVAGKASVLQSPSRETPGQVGLRGPARCMGSQKSPASLLRDLPGGRKGSLGSGRHWCPYQGSGTTMVSLT